MVTQRQLGQVGKIPQGPVGGAGAWVWHLRALWFPQTVKTVPASRVKVWMWGTPGSTSPTCAGKTLPLRPQGLYSWQCGDQGHMWLLSPPSAWLLLLITYCVQRCPGHYDVQKCQLCAQHPPGWGVLLDQLQGHHWGLEVVG